MEKKIIKLFLRFALAVGFLSAVADRFGLWPENVSAWGNWENFVEYTKNINPWFPDAIVPAAAVVATLAEVVLAALLIVGYKTAIAAKLSGILLLVFALAMTFSSGLKSAFDYSVYAAAAAAFGLSQLED
jgi:uncharacterized membrane protein YphA (DoxX/SURF4 family)